MEETVSKRLANTKRILTEATKDMTAEDSAEFYSELADWAYRESEDILFSI